MPNIEVRALDLCNQLATPLPLGSEPVSTSGLNYVWVHVEDAEGKVETILRFKVVDRQFVLRPDRYPEAVKEEEAAFKRRRPDYEGGVVWQATMVHYPIPGVARIESGIITVGDELDVYVSGLQVDSDRSSTVSLGTVTKIILGLS